MRMEIVTHRTKFEGIKIYASHAAYAHQCTDISYVHVRMEIVGIEPMKV
jgi:hypothetical protein